ncbi:MAG: aromatic ring-hydroxylating dioxygenase subunit alpha [Novosphingobium sp.]|nr:aromatic ring-hydroxylating dioxygenase subunit alpha [Novosphingobium sp.]MCP5401690.1 aromatic ring-hydroxylating dioxygenase subunit alpha [Novosphingobium sp.]
MQTTLPGERMDNAPLIKELDFTPFRMRVSTERYHSPEFHERERENLWMRVWQVAGRAEDIPEAGDWMEYRLFDQSWVLVRGKDGAIRGFVNACRHRGNAFCEGRGHAARFTCPYHNWSYGLDGQLLAVAKPDFDGTTEEFVGNKDELGLVQVPVEVFGGFIFLNPDRNAEPLADFLGEAAEFLAAYKCEEMVAHGLNVKETIECNWKVVMDAFQEGYHVQGVHPELVAAMDESLERYGFFGDHSIATAPFGAAHDAGVEVEIEGIRGLPATFPAVADALPRFEDLLGEHRGGSGEYTFPEGTTPRLLLQQALRETWTAKGLDVSGLTQNQLTDNQFYLLFPNFFITIHAGEGTFISSVPHPDGEPNRCIWHVVNYQWFPPEERAANKAELVEIAEDDHFPYFLALEQDYEQMEHQQRGLRQSMLQEMALTRQEVRLAHYHAAISSWVGE